MYLLRSGNQLWRVCYIALDQVGRPARQCSEATILSIYFSNSSSCSSKSTSELVGFNSTCNESYVACR